MGGLVVAALSGCGDDVAGPDAPTGSYTLTRVGDQKMPATLTDAAGSKLAFFEGYLEMQESGEFVLGVTGRLNAIEFDFEDWGHYQISGKNVAFLIDDEDYGDNFNGELGRNKVVVDYPIAGVKVKMVLEQRS